MTKAKAKSVVYHFGSLEDPRIDRRKRHVLMDIIVISICAVVCGAEDWVAVAEYGRAKHAWFSQFLALPNGIPSHDTFGRVFRRLDPDQFQQCFLAWIQALAPAMKGEVIAIDGKALRRSWDRTGGKAAIHMVSAWATARRLVLGQRKVDDKSNEITAIPELLRVLALEGCIVTIDAMGCQKEIAQLIRQKKGDYVFALKGNQGTLLEDVQFYFEQACQLQWKGIPHDVYETVDGDHGRIETRRYYTVTALEGLRHREQWAGWNMIGMIESIRDLQGTVSKETRYYIGSIGEKAERFGQAVRSHWGVENGLHWVLDIAFREDDCRIRKGYGPQNFAVLRHLALNLLKQEATAKIGVKNRRLRAGWDETYLCQVLFGEI